MAATIKAVYQNSVFRPVEPVVLREGQIVQLTIADDDSVVNDPAFNISALSVETGVTDLASEHDHYLYGTPKRSEREDNDNLPKK